MDAACDHTVPQQNWYFTPMVNLLFIFEMPSCILPNLHPVQVPGRKAPQIPFTERAALFRGNIVPGAVLLRNLFE